MEGAPGGESRGAQVQRRVSARVLPVLWLAALLCQLDRGNLAFAALQLNSDLGLTRSIYGLGSGLFFVGYSLAQLPVTLACVAVGPRRCLLAILVVWGALAACFALVRGEAAFLALRFLLGLAEAGAYPCFYYQLALFYPPSSLGVAYTWVASATAFSGLIGSPIAAGLLSLDGVAGLRGWQWLFVVEGLLPLLLAAAVPAILPAGPFSCAFLAPEEQQWLWDSVHGEGRGLEMARLGGGRAADSALGPDDDAGIEIAAKGSRTPPAGGPPPGAHKQGGAVAGAALRRSLQDGRVWYLGAAMLGIDACMNTTNFFAAKIIESSIQGDFDSSTDQAPTLRQVVQASLLTALPFTAAAVAMLANAYHSRRCNERALHTAVPLTVAAAGLGLLPTLYHHLRAAGAIVGLTVAASGIWATHGPFFSWGSEFLDPEAGALAFAVIKMMGAVGGFGGPSLVGLLAGRHGYGLPMPMLAGVCLLAALMAAVFESGGPGGSRTRFLRLGWCLSAPAAGYRWATGRLRLRRYAPLGEEETGRESNITTDDQLR